MNLLVDGKGVRTATGPNTQPGGSEQLEPNSWDVSEFLGKATRIQIVDDATGGWGHINVDHIVFTDAKPPSVRTNARRELIAERRYLHFPVKHGAAKRHVTVSVDGRTERNFDIELADAAPDWWAWLEISAWKGRVIVVQVDKRSGDSQALAALEQGDSIKDGEGVYRETLRPQFHFSSRLGWNNDPNGLVFFGGDYHPGTGATCTGATQ